MRRGTGLACLWLVTAGACGDGDPAAQSPLLLCGQRRLAASQAEGPADATRANEPAVQATKEDLQGEDDAALQAYMGSPVTLRGLVLDQTGVPLSGVTVSVAAQTGEVASDGTVVSESDGTFVMVDLSRHNRILLLEAQGRDAVAVPVYLAVPREVEEVDLPAIPMRPDDGSSVRFLFAGDFMMGRRFLDSRGETPPDEVPGDDPWAPVLVSRPAAGSREVVASLRAVFAVADYAVVNLESVVTDAPSDPDWEKSFVFFTLPGSLVALDELGVQYVSLGNNHVCDYGRGGLADTIAHLDAAGLGHSGASLDATKSFDAFQLSLGGARYALVSASWVSPSGACGVAALDTPEALTAPIAAEASAGRAPIALLHGGQEYSDYPSDLTKRYMAAAVRAGARLVVAHHPHKPQGLRLEDGVLVISSLGNFVFDQYRVDTFPSMVVEVEMGPGGARSAVVTPIVLDDYSPRAAVGPFAQRLLRLIGELSDGDALALGRQGERGHVVLPPQTPVVADRRREVEVTIPASRTAIVDLRGLGYAHESLRSVRVADVDGSGGSVTATLGRDLLLFGDFEDHDVDADLLEAPLWSGSTSSSWAPCVQKPYRGTAALCIYASGYGGATSNGQDSAWVRLAPSLTIEDDDQVENGMGFSVYGYARGDDAGAVSVQLSYARGADQRTSGGQTVTVHEEGTYPWTSFSADLQTSALGVSGDGDLVIDLGLSQQPPVAGNGRAVIDELAVIHWRRTVDVAGGAPLKTPHAFDFLRLQAAPGRYALELVFRTECAPHQPEPPPPPLGGEDRAADDPTGGDDPSSREGGPDALQANDYHFPPQRQQGCAGCAGAGSGSSVHGGCGSLALVLWVARRSRRRRRSSI